MEAPHMAAPHSHALRPHASHGGPSLIQGYDGPAQGGPAAMADPHTLWLPRVAHRVCLCALLYSAVVESPLIKLQHALLHVAFSPSIKS